MMHVSAPSKNSVFFLLFLNVCIICIGCCLCDYAIWKEFFFITCLDTVKNYYITMKLHTTVILLAFYFFSPRIPFGGIFFKFRMK